MSGVLLWGWDDTNKKWREVIVDSSGRINIGSVADAEISQATPEDMKHLPHGYYAAGPSYLPLAVDSAGKLLVTLSSLAQLNDIDNVSVPSPTDGYVLYWDAATSLWKAKLISATKIQDADGDTSWEVEKTADEDKIHGKVKGVEVFLLSDAGILTLAKQAAAKIYPVGGTNQKIPDATRVRILLDTTDFDIQSECDTTVKTGVADATEANKLHDADGGFASSDVGAWIWNTTDDTYTQVTAFVDSGELTLADDIMVNGDGYKLYHSTYTATEAGIYLVVVTATAFLADQERLIAYLYKNDVRQGSVIRYVSRAVGGYCQAVLLTATQLSANDVLDGRVKQDSGATETLTDTIGWTNLTVTKLA